MDINHVNENSFVCVMLWCPSFYWPGIHWNHLFGAIHIDSFDCQAVQIVESNFQTRPILHIDIWHIFL